MKFVKFCGTLLPVDDEAQAFWISLDEGAEVQVKAVPNQRTQKQNRAIHAFLRDLALQLNEAGMYIHVFPWKEGAEVEWKEQDTKSRLWIPLQEVITGKRHTSDLESKEVDRVYQPLAKKIAEMGVRVPPLGIE